MVRRTGAFARRARDRRTFVAMRCVSGLVAHRDLTPPIAETSAIHAGMPWRRPGWYAMVFAMRVAAGGCSRRLRSRYNGSRFAEASRLIRSRVRSWSSTDPSTAGPLQHSFKLDVWHGRVQCLVQIHTFIEPTLRLGNVFRWIEPRKRSSGESCSCGDSEKWIKVQSIPDGAPLAGRAGRACAPRHGASRPFGDHPSRNSVR